MIFIIVMIIDNLIKRILKEATTDSGSKGSYTPPLQPGIRDFDKSKLAPFTDSVSNYKSPLVAYDSYDHDWDLRRNQIRELEKVARKVTNFIKKHPESTNSDEDGNVSQERKMVSNYKQGGVAKGCGGVLENRRKVTKKY